MGLITRLAWRNLRKRPGQAVFLLLVMCLSTTTVSLGLAINETGKEPWLRLHNSINGYHVQAFAAYHTWEELNLPRLPIPDPVNVARAEHQLAGGARAPEVSAGSGPWPLLLVTEARVGGLGMVINVEVRDPKPATVSHPVVVSGQWLDESDDVVVLEDGVASLLKVKPGDEVTFAGQRLRVRGSAMTTSIPRYPMQFPATVWANRATAAKLLAAGAIPLGATLELRLARAEDAAAFVAAHTPTYGRPNLMQTWERARNRAGVLDMFAVAFTLLAILLAGLTIATAAVLVTGRMAAQGRQIGALKAVGLTPRQALRVVLVEHLALAMVAAAIGITAGTLLSPLIGRDLPVLYGAPAAPPITWPRALAALAIAMAVVVAGSVPAALRGVRHSTVRALASGARPPRRASRAARLAAVAGLPLPAVLGLRAALRRPARTIANATGLALGVAMVIVGLGASKLARDYLASPARDEEEALARTVTAIQTDQVLTIVFIGAGVLIGLAALNAMIAAIFAARDGARSHAIMRAVGATPRQTVISFVVAQFGASLLGCAAGIPLGVLLFNTVVSNNVKDMATISLPASVYVAVAVAAPLLYLLVAIVPAARLARRRVAPALVYE
jgi:putative ABC transport system permease protein